MDLNAWSTLHWAQPAWLWALPALVALGVWTTRTGAEAAVDSGLPGHGGSTRDRFRHPRLDLLAAAQSEAGRPARRQFGLWRLLALACVVLALAQPQLRGAQLPESAQRRDLVFVVDNSVAMNLRDYQFQGQRVDRLTVLKGVLNRFVDKLHGDRISVILYADNAYTLVPLTHDHDLVRSLLARVDTGLAGRSNALGDAVALAVQEADTQSRRRRALVLFSSAARPTGTISPLDAARLAAQRQLPLYTVAIGAGSSAAAETRSSGLIYDPSDRARLQAMARITGAESYVATDTADLEAAVAAIARLETEPDAAEPRYRLQSLYPWPLALGMLLLSVAQLRSLWRGRP